MFYQLIILISFLYFINISSITIYECSKIELISEQCMLNWTDKNGNTHISLKTCPNTKICKTNRDKSMGFCIDNLKTVFAGEQCNYISECITNILDSNHYCIGIGEHLYCNPKKKDCNPKLSCRLTERNKEIAYRCANLSKINETCEINDHCELRLVCAKNKNISELNITTNESYINISDIPNYIDKDDYLNLTYNKTCINRASLKNGELVDEAMACESGELIKINIFNDTEELICGSKEKIIKDCDLNKKCILQVDIGIFGKIPMEQECIFTALGNLVCPLNEKEKAWKKYLEKYEEILIKDEIIEEEKSEDSKKEISYKVHIPYYKDTLKNSELSEYFWKYNDWIHNIDADECVKQYFFVNNKSESFYYNIYLLIIYILLIY